MGKRKPGKPNKIKLLPEELIKEIKAKLLVETTTLEEIRHLINAHPLCNAETEIKLSSVWRYAKEVEDEVQELSDLDNFFKMLPENISFDKESKVHKLISQILSKSILKQISGREDIDVKELFFLSKSLKEIMSSTKDREKIEGDIEKRVKEKAIKEVEKAGKSEGLSEQTIANLKKALSS